MSHEKMTKMSDKAKAGDWTLDMKPRNKIEEDFSQRMRKLGYLVIQRGWPDFAIVKYDGKPMIVEVKSTNDSLRPEQIAILTLLADYGLDVRISNGLDNGRPLTYGELEWGHRLLWIWGNTRNHIVQKRYPTEDVSPNDHIYYSIRELANQLGISHHSASEAVLSGQIPSQRINNQIVVMQDDLKAWLAGSITTIP
jgi:hypothetical protein